MGVQNGELESELQRQKSFNWLLFLVMTSWKRP